MQVLLQNVGEEGKAIFGKVCDLSSAGEPEATISSLAHDMNHADITRKTRDGHLIDTRLLVCGGDGTVTWILTALEQCQALQGKLDALPMAVVPLGTGNDLARSLGWGSRLTAVSDIIKYLRWLGQADVVTLDKWRIVLRPHKSLPEDHKLRTPGSHPQLIKDKALRSQLNRDLEKSGVERRRKTVGQPSDEEEQDVYLGFWQNYYSLGIDAKVARAVDLVRKSRCGRCIFRFGAGKVVYGFQGARHMWCNQDLERSLTTMKIREPDAQGGPKELSPPLHEQAARAGAKQLIFANINSYAAGMKVLPEPPVVKRMPDPGDGILEVLTVRNMIAMLAAGFLGCGRLNYLASGEAVAFTLQEGIDMQLDGEAWNLEVGCDVLLEPHRKVPMLRAPSSSSKWGGIFQGRHITQDFWRLVPSLERVSQRWSSRSIEEALI